MNEAFEVNQEGTENNVTFFDIFDFYNQFCAENQELSDDTEKQKLFSIARDSVEMFDTETYRAMRFAVESGNYGVEAVMIDRKTKRATHRRSADEAAVMRFNCIIYVPKDIGEIKISKGILIFETIGIYGAKTVTTQYLRQFFSQYGVTFETRSVSVKIFMDKLIEQGNLYRITLINNKISPNNADNMLISSGREVRSYLKPRLKPEFLKNMLSWFEHADRTGVCEIPNSEPYDDIAVTFKINDHTRTMRLKNIERMSIVEDIPEEIFRLEDSEQRLISYMIDTADEYRSKMVVSMNDGDI